MKTTIRNDRWYPPPRDVESLFSVTTPRQTAVTRQMLPIEPAMCYPPWQSTAVAGVLPHVVSRLCPRWTVSISFGHVESTMTVSCDKIRAPRSYRHIVWLWSHDVRHDSQLYGRIRVRPSSSLHTIRVWSHGVRHDSLLCYRASISDLVKQMKEREDGAKWMEMADQGAVFRWP